MIILSIAAAASLLGLINTTVLRLLSYPCVVLFFQCCCGLPFIQYTVGCVYALPDERAAAEEMFDEEHLPLEDDPFDNDENSYSLDSICGHNVVIVCLSAGQIGNNLAASVAIQMRATFRQLRFGLIVGNDGGVPIVSQPHGTFGGVVQYDMGKSTTAGFQRTGALNSPLKFLLSAMTKLQSNESRGRSKRNDYVKKVEAVPTGKFARSNADLDILVEKAYMDENGRFVDSRPPRNSAQQVVVHYGTIASGNPVIKDATVRDEINVALGGGVFRFEMEAAGLMNSFPCLVVRGVCDYADSQKSDLWQPYAAATAAAYAKELLSMISSGDVVNVPTVDETIILASAKPTYHLPFQRNRRFRLVVDQDCRKMSILGLGGTGKTQVALEFAHLANLDIAEAFKIPEATIKEEDPKQLVRLRLSLSRARPWLLTGDNADDADIFFGTGQQKGIHDYLAGERKRNSELGAMSREDAKDFLAKSLTRKDLFRDNMTTTELYLSLLHNTEHGLVSVMSREFCDDTWYKGSVNAVATTWVVRFIQIRKYDTLAAALLELVSCIE
ncbi:purine and uridine phosphorylase [Macroventuria anomochaeta]|uniref:Purine and uridine phosphorylase n=1 Tax=Macroventuria anomochaeta TaxID=301207 RepID=A0ACB6S8V9_9PLEO|nr:purine and uridine phosphorylase [Macroventuria anomochaeta]KAF2630551.1 purine and uridine phosphorylase [Macroventuria anomochaeta]